MDLSTLDMGAAAEKGAVFTARHPVTDEDLDVRIRVMGADSPEWRRALGDVQRQAAKKRGNQPLSIAAQEKIASEILARVTISWENVEWEGKPLECTRENALMLYQARPWLRSQVDEFAAERANFFASAATD